MKQLLITFLIVCNTALFAQNKEEKLRNKIITEANVSSVIGTLAADNMNGRSAFRPEDIGKASQYLEKQFAKIGLKKWQDLKGYSQPLGYSRLDINILEVTINGQKVEDKNLLLISESTTVQLGPNTPIKTVEKDKSFYAAYRNFASDTSSKIVLVDPSHASNFTMLKGYYGGPKILRNKERSKGHTLFIIAPTDSKNIEAKANLTETSAQMNNVVGWLPGKSKPNEYVIFSGHYDHIGLLEAVDGDIIANGADDDASGTTAVVSLARYFKKLKNNERSIIFVAFTAEEIGGYGSKFFSENLNPDQIVAMINIEMIGKKSKWGTNSAFMTGFERSNLGKIMQKNLEGSPFKLQPDPYPEQNLFYRSDNATLARLGVPAHSFSTDQIDIDPLYHTVNDELESMEMANIVATIKALSIATKSIIAGQDTPTRVDKSKVN